MAYRGSGEIQKKILLLLQGGLALGLSCSPARYFKIVRMIKKEWKEIEQKELRRSIRSLYVSKMITGKERPDGTISIVLSEKGKERVLKYHLETIKIKKPLKWDGKWRLVMFDIPEARKQARDALRARLKQIGFLEFQKSAFIQPYPCSDEINFLIEFYMLRTYVRIMLVDEIDNELHLKMRFHLK